MPSPVTVSEEQLQNQFTYIDAVSALTRGKQLRAYTHTFGCQQNEADTERIRGMLHEMGYHMTDRPEDADFILYNTCAVREHAEDRAFGNIGALSHLKKQRPDVVIALCGCMAQQEKNVEKIKKSYPQVSLLFGTHALWRFPSLLYRVLTEKKRVFDIGGEDDIAEGLPVLRAQGPKAWLSIMYGCNNFCTYCIVPHVRGRERSRRPEEIEKELRELVAAGYKEITLLGQNVNSYGKDLGLDIDFADLLRRLNAVPGDFWLRFMTSHPKDASSRLFDAMAQCEKVAKQLHLPFQSGSDEILRRMNRRYTADGYRALITDARSKMPDITLSSDIIVGFPGETDEDFEQTLQLVEDVRFDLLFTFLYSPRTGTPAASYEDNATPQEKQQRFERLLKAQDAIVAQRQAAYQSKTVRLLVDGTAKGPEYPFTARTEGNLLVCVRGADIEIGSFIEAEIEKTSLRCLFARKI
ncbi:tRNA (N6-isopentenyl adenosine(37)-C2)-methylthiotransferase MiaB [Candidatus Agathobaculum pullicola]|uniref:tRNA (N6-isopentenyl adenosine(37)-C2)-methylthiotransferase MiaB n=1 Tax=Candidatus Agathobaculum pullicola TaxID=2838426 RepID=UPI003F8FF77A